MLFWIVLVNLQYCLYKNTKFIIVY